jgi:hypothetical protein
MRLRWIAVVFVFFGSIIAVLSVCSDTAGSVDTIVGMCRRITYGVLFAAGFWGMSYLLQRWMNQPVLAGAPTPARAREAFTEQPPAPPVPTFEVSGEVAPARYRVRGYDRDTHFETIEFVYADSPSNAQMKVELKGVVVSSVEAAG